MRRWIARLALLTPLVVLAACGYAPGDIGNPLARKVTWFSFVAGDDVRTACRPGAPDQFRIVYNGVWAEQVRIYEIGFGGPHQLDQRVIGAGRVDELSISDPLLAWRGTSASLTLSAEEYATLLRDLDQSGAYRSPDTTLTLAGNDFYWVAATCHEGAFHLTAWLYPSDGFSRATFPTWLIALDKTGVPFNPPRPWTEVGTGFAGTGGAYGYAGNPARNIRPPGDWAFGIAQDRMVGRVDF